MLHEKSRDDIVKKYEIMRMKSKKKKWTRIADKNVDSPCKNKTKRNLQLSRMTSL